MNFLNPTLILLNLKLFNDNKNSLSNTGVDDMVAADFYPSSTESNVVFCKLPYLEAISSRLDTQDQLRIAYKPVLTFFVQ